VFDGAGQEQSEETDEGVHVDLVVGPMVLGPYGEVFVVFALAEDCLDVALASVGQGGFLSGPLVPVGDDTARTEDQRM